MAYDTKTEIPEFKDDYTKETLGSVSRDISYGIGAAAKPYDFEYRYLRITDIDEASFTNLTYENSVSPNCTQREANEYILSKGDLVLARTGASVGKMFLNTKYDNLVYAGFLIRFKINNKALPYYLASSLQTQRYHKWVSVMSVRSGQPGINAKEYSQYPLNLPSLQEQRRVSDLFNSLDRKINFLTKKKEVLETYKKGLMQGIFSQELRFKREDGTDYPDWRIVSLGEVSEVIMGQSPSSSSYNELGEGLLLAQGKADFEDSVFNSVRYTSEPTKVIPAKTILMSVRAPVGFIGYADREVCIGRGMCAIKTAHMSYIHAYLTFYQTEWRKIQQGSTFEAVSGKDIKDVKVPMPTSELEERSITECFNLIDNKIKVISNLLNNTLSLKKGLLQQMFV